MKILRKFLSWLLFWFRGNKKIVSFILWPLTKRCLGLKYSELKNIGNNIKMLVPTSMLDMSAKTLLFYSDKIEFAWEPVTTRLFMKLLTDKNVVVVAGANMGYYALIAAAIKPASIVYTFEPVTEYYNMTKGNILLNNFSNIFIERLALSNKNEIAIIMKDNGQSAIVEKTESIESMDHSENVGCVTLDSYLKNPPDLILLDVEGFELSVLSGAVNIIDQYHPDVIFEVGHSKLGEVNVNINALISFFKDREYNLFLIKDDYNGSLVRSFQKDYVIDLVEFTKDIYNKQDSSWMNIYATTKKYNDIFN